MSDAQTDETEGEAREDLHELTERYGLPAVTSRGMPVLFVDRGELPKLVRRLHDDGYLVCLDVTAVDYLTFGQRATAEGDVRSSPRELPGGIAPERFEVVYHLFNHRERRRLRLRVQVPGSEPTVPSITGVHPGAEALEREVFDMFGIEFSDHPDLTRILMPEDWIGHPLRKDYHSGRIPVQFKDAPTHR